MSKKHAVTVALVITTTLFITACGLQGDLYMPEEKAASEAATPAEAQSTDSESTDNETTEGEKSNPSSEQAP